MKRIKLRFEREPELDQIDVLIRASEQDAQVTELMERISGQPPDVLTVTATSGEILRIALDDIVSASVTDKVTLLTTESGRYALRQPLHTLEAALGPARFLRISRHELINLNKIRTCDFTINGALRMELAGGVETWVSRRFIPEVRRRIQGKE